MVKQSFNGREHREREQPKSRARLGFLEKHADYVKRAQSYHENTKEYIELAKAAAQNHPDEFCFGMVHAEVDENGCHIPKDLPINSQQMKSQNATNRSYLQTQYNIDTKKIQKLAAGLANLSDAGKANRRTLFVESAQEGIELLTSHNERLIRNPVETVSVLSQEQKLVLNEATEKQYAELRERKKRSLTLKGLIDFIDEEAKLSSKGKRKLFKRKDGTQYYKWEPDRLK
jgi:U3 small nucleolar RNA-associated protein 11